METTVDYNATSTEASQPVEQITNLADNFLKQAFQKFQYASKTFELDKYSEEIGLGPISKQLTIDRVKTILAGYATLKIMNSVRSNFLKIGIVGGIGYLLLQNKDQFMALFNKTEYINQHLTPSEPVPQPVIQTDQMAGIRQKVQGDFSRM